MRHPAPRSLGCACVFISVGARACVRGTLSRTSSWLWALTTLVNYVGDRDTCHLHGHEKLHYDTVWYGVLLRTAASSGDVNFGMRRR